MKNQSEAPMDHRAKTLPFAGGEALPQLAQALLTELREGGSGEEPLHELASLETQRFFSLVHDDACKKAFWINAYNAFNLYGMRLQPTHTLAAKKQHFFSRRQVVAGMPMSLNHIEHGILRRSKLWWAQGWLRKPFPGSLERRLRLEQDDPRIHFALNCGANGCPAIRFYTATGIEHELETATRAFFATEVNVAHRHLLVSSIFRMYLGDFGGKRGLRRWLIQYRPELDAKLPIRFLPYDWSPNLDKFASADEKE